MSDLIELLRLPRRRDAKTETETVVSLRRGPHGAPVLEVRERSRSLGATGAPPGAWSYNKRPAGVHPDEWDQFIVAIVTAQECVEAAQLEPDAGEVEA